MVEAQPLDLRPRCRFCLITEKRPVLLVSRAFDFEAIIHSVVRPGNLADGKIAGLSQIDLPPFGSTLWLVIRAPARFGLSIVRLGRLVLIVFDR
jgi:hypothetical protein